MYSSRKESDLCNSCIQSTCAFHTDGDYDDYEVDDDHDDDDDDDGDKNFVNFEEPKRPVVVETGQNASIQLYKPYLWMERMTVK